MSNLSLKINLSKISGATLVKMKGKSGAVKEVMVIPVETANLYKGEKGVYLDLIGIEAKEAKFNQSHFIKPNISKEAFDAMSKEEKDAVPIVGNISKLERTATEVQASETATIAGEEFKLMDDDLPF